MTTVVTVCDTCRVNGREMAKGQIRDGEKLAVLVEQACESHADVTVRRHPCLMACQQGCNVAVQGDAKLTYVLGRFEPTAEAANGIAEYAKLYGESNLGQVPFKQWPAEIKGHFVSRVPPLESDGK